MNETRLERKKGSNRGGQTEQWCSRSRTALRRGARQRFAQGREGDQLLGSFRAARAAGVDPVLHDVAGAEDQHLARRDGNLFARLGIAPNAFALLANAERAERRKLHLLAARQAVRDLVQNELHELLRLVAR